MAQRKSPETWIAMERLIALTYLAPLTAIYGQRTLAISSATRAPAGPKHLMLVTPICRSCPSNHHCNGTVCTPCKECPPGQEPIGFCTIRTDTVCGRCPNNTYSNASSTTIRCQVCTHLTCQPDLRLRSCSSFADASCDECGDNSYYNDRFNRCVPCKSCAYDELETTSCTMSTDRECQQASLPTVYPWGSSWSTLKSPPLAYSNSRGGFIITTGVTSANISTATYHAAATQQRNQPIKMSSSSPLIVISLSVIGSVSFTVILIFFICRVHERRKLTGNSSRAGSMEETSIVSGCQPIRQRRSFPNNMASGGVATNASMPRDDLLQNDLHIRPNTLIDELPGSTKTTLFRKVLDDCTELKNWNEMSKCFQQSGACRESKALGDLFELPCADIDYKESSRRAKELLEIWEKEHFSLWHLKNILKHAEFLQTVKEIDGLLVPDHSETGQCHEVELTGVFKDVDVDSMELSPKTAVKPESEASATGCSFSENQPTTIAERRQRVDQERELFYDKKRNFLVDSEPEASTSPKPPNPSKAKRQLMVNHFAKDTPPSHDTEV